MQERCNSIANALEIGLSCTNPSIPHWGWNNIDTISHTTHTNAFSWTVIGVLKFHRSFFLIKGPIDDMSSPVWVIPGPMLTKSYDPPYDINRPRWGDSLHTQFVSSGGRKEISGWSAWWFSRLIFECGLSLWPDIFIWSHACLHGRIYYNVIVFDIIAEMNILTHCGLVTPYGDMEVGQHWLR